MERNLLIFLAFLRNEHANIKFVMEKQVNHSIHFLDLLVADINMTFKIHNKWK